MSEPRDIHVTLTHSEYVALRTTVDGELESFTDDDWDGPIAAALDAASKALTRGWQRWARRPKKVAQR